MLLGLYPCRITTDGLSLGDSICRRRQAGVEAPRVEKGKNLRPMEAVREQQGVSGSHGSVERGAHIGQVRKGAVTRLLHVSKGSRGGGLQ